MLATDHVFLVTAVGFVLGAGAVWIAPKPKPLKPKPMAEPMVEH